MRCWLGARLPFPILFLIVLCSTGLLQLAHAVTKSVASQSALVTALADSNVTDIIVTSDFELHGKEINITRSINIVGSCGSSRCVLHTDGRGPDRVFNIPTPGIAVSIQGLTFTAPQVSSNGSTTAEMECLAVAHFNYVRH
eukprot:jgi/Mesvir1/7799/Mv25285-RA.1